MSKRVWIPVMFFAVLASVSLADTISLTSTQDAFFRRYYPGYNYGSSGRIVARDSSDHGDVCRSVVRFDLSTLDSLTSQATDGTLSLTVHSIPSGAGSLVLNFHRVLNSWVEGTGGSSGNTSGGVSWSYRDIGTTTWSGVVNPPITVPGGTINYEMLSGTDYEADAFCSKTVSSASIAAGSVVTFDFGGSAALAVIQDWIENPDENYGFVIMPQWVTGSDPINKLEIDFYSRNDGTASNRPNLTIEYDVVPEPTTLGLLVFGGLALIRRRIH